MRDTLTALAGVVILVLVAALAAPPFIDWAGQRDLIDRTLSVSLGVPARSEGRISVRLGNDVVIQRDASCQMPHPRPADRCMGGKASSSSAPILDAVSPGTESARTQACVRVQSQICNMERRARTIQSLSSIN